MMFILAIPCEQCEINMGSFTLRQSDNAKAFEDSGFKASTFEHMAAGGFAEHVFCLDGLPCYINTQLE